VPSQEVANWSGGFAHGHRALTSVNVGGSFKLENNQPIGTSYEGSALPTRRQRQQFEGADINSEYGGTFRRHGRSSFKMPAVASSSTTALLQKTTQDMACPVGRNAIHGKTSQQAVDDALLHSSPEGTASITCRDTLTEHGSKRAVMQQWRTTGAGSTDNQFGSGHLTLTRHGQRRRLNEHRFYMNTRELAAGVKLDATASNTRTVRQ